MCRLENAQPALFHAVAHRRRDRAIARRALHAQQRMAHAPLLHPVEEGVQRLAFASCPQQWRGGKTVVVMQQAHRRERQYRFQQGKEAHERRPGCAFHRTSEHEDEGEALPLEQVLQCRHQQPGTVEDIGFERRGGQGLPGRQKGHRRRQRANDLDPQCVCHRLRSRSVEGSFH
ncbi:hypothetical protein D3C71_1583690 [compost metagenome]